MGLFATLTALNVALGMFVFIGLDDVSEEDNEGIDDGDQVERVDVVSVDDGDGLEDTANLVSDDDHEETIDVVSEDEAIVEGVDLVFDGSQTLLGTEGNDTLAGGQNPELEEYLVDLGAGNDTAILDFDDNGPIVNLLGGQGDDYIVADHYSGQIDGGEGDDTIIAGYGTAVDGGAGNDSISIDMSDAGGDEVHYAHGGEGDDTLEVASLFGSSAPDFPTTSLTGGEGSDTFLAELTLIEDDYTVIYETPPSSTGSYAGVMVRDFDPAEDTLTITLDRSEGQEDRVLESLGVLLSPSSDNIYEIYMTFSATDDDPAHTVRVYVSSEVPLTASDFTVIDLYAV